VGISVHVGWVGGKGAIVSPCSTVTLAAERMVDGAPV
jgi:hypothetical protein